MTGKDLIIYILKNDLEDVDIFKDGKFMGFLTEKEIAAKFNVGTETIKTWCYMGFLPYIKIGDSFFFWDDINDPRKSKHEVV